jgi:multiple antibiotic resistance protein
MLDYAQLVHVFVTLISILNPLGIIPIFLAVTADEDPQQKKVTIKKTVTAVALILLLSAFGGTYPIFSGSISTLSVLPEGYSCS